MSTKTNTNIPFNEYKQGFKQWKESTTTSPSGRNLGHHHSLLASVGTQYNKDKEYFSDRMWHIHRNITSIALLNEKPLVRWLTSIVILLPKDIETQNS